MPRPHFWPRTALVLAVLVLLPGCFLFKAKPADPVLVHATEILAPRIVELTTQASSFDALSKTGQAVPDQALIAGQAYYQLGLAQENSGRRDDAIKAYERASEWAHWGLRALSASARLEIVRADSEIRLSWIAGMGEAMPHTLKAVLALQSAKKLKPEDAEFLDAQARSWIYLPVLGGGKPEQAVDYWTAAASKEGADAWAALWAGEACRQLKQADAARKWYARALELDPSLGLARLGMKKL